MRGAGIAALALAAALAAGAPARAEEAAPVGRWTTIDDATGKPTSVVRIWEEDGKLRGEVESVVVKPGEDPAPRCTKCEGARKDQPIVGMVILWDLVRDGGQWKGGQILDPDNGSTYRCTLEPADGGEKLKVRGYIGISLFGRTQVWVKAP